MLSWPWALFGLRLTIIFSILLVVKLIVRNLLSVTYLRFVGSLLQFFNKEHWLENKELKSSAFSLKSVGALYTKPWFNNSNNNDIISNNISNTNGNHVKKVVYIFIYIFSRLSRGCQCQQHGKFYEQGHHQSINKIQFIQATIIATTMSSLTTSVTLMEILSKRELFSYSSISSASYQELVNVNNMGNFMNRTINSQFHFQCVVKKASGMNFTSSL